ncbi:DUF1643 domain-containing protein [Mesorhizobium sp. M0910]|uniref:DUF1643 domain-containing protein n=1 Tax=unclassified Mesorhizobium TaxID=325217 RepID=UPI0033352360
MTAIFSECRQYRYRLDRPIGGRRPPVAFLLHNPSIADEEADDATLRRGIGYAKLWGCERLTFINPWARIATLSRELWASGDPVGPLNDGHILRAATEVKEAGGFIVLGWGVIRPPRQYLPAATSRLRDVEQLVRETGCEIRALGSNKDGSPKHPLYISRESKPFLWPPSSVSRLL